MLNDMSWNRQQSLEVFEFIAFQNL